MENMNKRTEYANGFSYMINGDTGESVITFVKDCPVYNEETGAFDSESRKEVVASLVVPFDLIKSLSEAIQGTIEEIKADQETVTEE